MIQPNVKAFDVTDWAKKAATAAQTLEALQGAVQTVDAAGWPENI
jgi:hypothetical protein